MPVVPQFLTIDRHQEFDPSSNEMKRREISRYVARKPLRHVGGAGVFIVAAVRPQYLKLEQGLLMAIQQEMTMNTILKNIGQGMPRPREEEATST